MACFHLHGDADGETHLTRLEFPVKDTVAGTVRGLNDVPVTTMGFGEFVGGRKPDAGLHNAPRRQFLVVLRGELELESSTGELEYLHPGDVLLADDIGAKGHRSRDVGEEPLTLMAIGVASDWDGP
jgi:uncharacterized cupin superfamily protein